MTSLQRLVSTEFITPFINSPRHGIRQEVDREETAQGYYNPGDVIKNNVTIFWIAFSSLQFCRRDVIWIFRGKERMF